MPRTIKNPITGKSYTVVERKPSAATIEKIKWLWKEPRGKTRKIYW